MSNAGRRTRPLLFATAWIAWVIAWIAGLAPIGFAQLPAAPSHETNAPEFDVATIKLSSPEARSSSLNLGADSVVSTNMPLTRLIQFAYNLNWGSVDQIVGGPPWIGSSKFDINAKDDAQLAARINNLPPEERLATLRQMVQALLADRFQLKVHHETRDIRVLALTVAKGGPKLTETKPGSHDGSWTGLHNPERGKTEARGATIKMLVDALSSKPEIGGRLVIDDTGLSGKYDFELTWAPEDLAPHTGDDTGGSSLFVALQEQLGLRVEPRKGPVDCIVIDHVEMPSQN